MTTFFEQPEMYWAIGGSDNTAGAGIQADIHTAHSFGVHCATLITANTAQCTEGMQAVNPVSVGELQSQYDALLKEFRPKIIKVGMLANVDQICWLSERIVELKSHDWELTVIVDPVMTASNGGSLTETDTGQALREVLLPLADIVTANWMEAGKLSAIEMSLKDGAQQAAKIIQKIGPDTVIIKGGHKPTPQISSDYCLLNNQEVWLHQKRREINSCHGTGCSFASAIAATLSMGYNLEDACILANAYVIKGISCPTNVAYEVNYCGHHGFPSELEYFPKLSLIERKHSIKEFASCDTDKLGLYPVVDDVEWIEKLLELGIKTIQLRIKGGQETELRWQIQTASELAKKHQARLFINDHWQLAIEYQCYGVHLGQEDLLSADLKAIKKAGLRLGISTHSYFELLTALEIKPSYVAIGAIFPTTTKDMTGQIQGIFRLSKYLPLVAGIPAVAIGGISGRNASKVLDTGVGSIAVVRAITEAIDTQKAVGKLNEIISHAV